MEIQPLNTLGKMLFQDFSRRKSNNPAYSIRGYARYLDISHSTLRFLMDEKTEGSPKLVQKIGKKLGLTSQEVKYFIQLSRLKKARHPEKKNQIYQGARVINTRFNTLSEKEFTDISQWYSYAVMELIKTKDAQLDPAWLANRLGILAEEAKGALSALQKLDIIGIQDGKKLIVKRDYLEFPDGQFEAARTFHQTVTGKAKEATATQVKGTRSFSSAVVRFRKSDLPDVHEFIARFRREFCQRFEGGTDHDSVYALNLNFFRLDQE